MNASIALGQVEERVKSALTVRGKQLASVHVAATAADTVHLSGWLPSFYLRQIAVAAAQHVAGVLYVSDEIHVGHTAC